MKPLAATVSTSNDPIQHVSYLVLGKRVSLSRASKIAGLEIIDFQNVLSDRGIYVHYDVEDFEQDVQHLRDQRNLIP